MNKNMKWLILGAFTMVMIGCGSARQAKRGCPTNSASMGAEKVLAGEKPDKKSKFKIKGMN